MDFPPDRNFAARSNVRDSVTIEKQMSEFLFERDTEEDLKIN
jgi:hypothetical protein